MRSDPPAAPLGARPGLEANHLADAIMAHDQTVLAAIDDVSGDVVGLVLVMDDEVGAVPRSPALHVSHLVVARKHRRRGVGRALLAATVQLAEQRGIDHILASAATTSRDANRYLARLGFAPYVARRIAPTAVLRRSLGLAGGSDRLALIRRVRGGGPPSRAVRAALDARSVRRGA
ncbi:MAG: GNAT family N-acetyltransferase [Actinomycetota bacterium]